jgi:hypothetical protein
MLKAVACKINMRIRGETSKEIGLDGTEINTIRPLFSTASKPLELSRQSARHRAKAVLPGSIDREIGL